MEANTLYLDEVKGGVVVGEAITKKRNHNLQTFIEDVNCAIDQALCRA